MSGSLDPLVRDARVLVCVGSGGVGKTTTSAVLALQAALQGRRALVMTIDPARRLANSLGIEALDHAIAPVDLSAFDASAQGSGTLHATMLDMKQAFDQIVERHARDEATRDAILGNRFYRFFSTSLAGAQELSASERLWEVVNSGDWDLVVLDTPPTSNALDFLEAPTRYFEALDSNAMHLVLQTSDSIAKRRSGALLSAGSGMVLRTLSRITGTELFEELSEFLRHFSSLFEGFRERTLATRTLFADPKTAFVIISSPDPATIGEADYFRGRLDAYDVRLGGVVINRVHQRFAESRWGEATPNALADALAAIPGADVLGQAELLRLARKLLRNAEEFDRLAERDESAIDDFATLLGGDVPLARVPLHASDIHSAEGLSRIRADLFGAT